MVIFSIFLMSFSRSQNIESNPVQNFNVTKYLGTWYEIARTDNRFEKGCKDAKADYSLREDGGLKIVNTCFVNGKEKVSKGKAYFKNSKNIGALKVTFFWPFYGSYNIVYLDENYQYAIVDGGSKNYLWILSRSKTIDEITLAMLIEKIKQNGFDPSTLMFVSHSN